MIKIQGSSIRGEFVYCDICGKQFVWLYALKDNKSIGTYFARCAKCRGKK
ncbi:MAG: hypothetical protein WBL93_06590 [Lutisporaceae bacterium]